MEVILFLQYWGHVIACALKDMVSCNPDQPPSPHAAELGLKPPHPRLHFSMLGNPCKSNCRRHSGGFQISTYQCAVKFLQISSTVWIQPTRVDLLDVMAGTFKDLWWFFHFKDYFFVLRSRCACYENVFQRLETGTLSGPHGWDDNTP